MSVSTVQNGGDPLSAVKYLQELAPLLFTAFGAYSFYDSMKKLRVIKDTPTSKIRSAAQGYLELRGYGEALGVRTVIGPESKHSCLWFDYTVEHLKLKPALRGKKRQGKWVRKHHQRSKECFIMSDETGKCIVDPLRADIIPTKKWVRYKNAKGRHCSSHNATVRHIERIIEIGSPLVIIGEFKTLHHAGLHGNAIDKIIDEWRVKNDALIGHLDQDGDGHIDADEWERALSDMETDLVKPSRGSKNSKAGLHIIMHPRHGKKPYIIAGKKPTRLMWSYRFRMIGSLLIALFGLAVYFREWFGIIDLARP